MNSVNKTPFKRRSDPFSTTPSSSVNVVEEKKPITDEKPKFETKEPVVEEQPKVVVKEVIVEKPKQVVAKPAPKKVVAPDLNDANREKYTATMDKELRIRVKKAAIDLGLQVSSFIEVACLEKLEREGK